MNVIMNLYVLYRDHFLTSWIELIAKCPVSQGLYEPVSFLHDAELFQFILNTLAMINSVVIRLEPLLTQGL